MENYFLILSLVFGIIGFWFVVKLLLILWLWFFHDKPLKRTQAKLLEVPEKINKEYIGRGVTKSGIEPFIKAEERTLKIELEKRELKRKLFLDRINLIFKLKTS